MTEKVIIDVLFWWDDDGKFLESKLVVVSLILYYTAPSSSLKERSAETQPPGRESLDHASRLCDQSMLDAIMQSPKGFFPSCVRVGIDGRPGQKLIKLHFQSSCKQKETPYIFTIHSIESCMHSMYVHTYVRRQRWKGIVSKEFLRQIIRSIKDIYECNLSLSLALLAWMRAKKKEIVFLLSQLVLHICIYSPSLHCFVHSKEVRAEWTGPTARARA